MTPAPLDTGRAPLDAAQRPDLDAIRARHYSSLVKVATSYSGYEPHPSDYQRSLPACAASADDIPALVQYAEQSEAHITKLTAQNDALREQRDVALRHLHQALLCDDDCAHCASARAILGEP